MRDLHADVTAKIIAALQQAADYVQGMAKPAPRAPAEVAEAA